MDGSPRRGRIVFVHGLGPKPPAAHKRELLWRSLRAGVARVDEAAAALLDRDPEALELVYWADLLYGQPLDPEAETAAVARALDREGADRLDQRAARTLRRRVQLWLNRLADRFPALVNRFADARIALHLSDARRYFSDRDRLGSRIRARLHAALQGAWAGDRRVLLIAHSMGSVIAWDTLWELTHLAPTRHRVDLLLTLGSPLGTRWARRRLLGARAEGREAWAGSIRCWYNVAAAGDLAAIYPRLARDFAPMMRMELAGHIEDLPAVEGWYRDDRGLNVHKSYGYLMHPTVGRVVARWLHGETPPGTGGSGRPGRDG